jgi:hypothetical protein
MGGKKNSKICCVNTGNDEERNKGDAIRSRGV